MASQKGCGSRVKDEGHDEDKVDTPNHGIHHTRSVCIYRRNNNADISNRTETISQCTTKRGQMANNWCAPDGWMDGVDES